MIKLFKKVYFVLSGGALRERARKRAEELAKRRRDLEKWQREQAAIRTREAEERLAHLREEPWLSLFSLGGYERAYESTLKMEDIE